MLEKPWYQKGLRFECTGCGGCCTGAPGFVWVNKAEVAALAAYLGMEIPRFEASYVRCVGIRKSLIERPNGDCIFLDQRACRVYSVRPRQCGSWPFWESNLSSPQRWAQICEACPGAGTGNRVNLEEIQRQMALRRV